MQFGNSYTSGNTETSISLFIKNTSGVYKNHLGFPGMLPDALSTVSQGYPDLLIGGPGFEFPVLRWNGKTYANHHMVKDDAYEKLKKKGGASQGEAHLEQRADRCQLQDAGSAGKAARRLVWISVD